MTEYFIARSSNGVDGVRGTLVKRVDTPGGFTERHFKVVVQPERTVSQGMGNGATEDYWYLSRTDALTLHTKRTGALRPANGTRVIGFNRTLGGKGIPGYVGTATDEFWGVAGQIVVTRDHDGAHGTLADSWVVLPDNAETVLVPHGGKVPQLETLTHTDDNEAVKPAKEKFDVASLDDEAKGALVEVALAAARKRGYCDEAENVLRDLGLMPKKRRTVVLTLEVEEDEEGSFDRSNVKVEQDGVTLVGITQSIF